MSDLQRDKLAIKDDKGRRSTGVQSAGDGCKNSDARAQPASQ